jgi:hypothetical protein
MTDDETFDELEKRGAARAAVYFSGGNDEGGPDHAVLHDADGGILDELDGLWEHPRFDEGLNRWVTEPPTPQRKRDHALFHALAGPVYEEYGDFGGEPYVSGEVVRDAATRTVRIDSTPEDYPE